MLDKSDYIKIIKEFSTQYGDKLVDLMEQFGVNSLSEVTTEMAIAYIDEHPMMRKRRFEYEQMVNGRNTCL